MAELYDALNYPYVRVRNVDWLKSTLLLFPHVARIRPHGAPNDDPEIDAFTRIIGASEQPLLWSIDPDDISFERQKELERHISDAISKDAAGLKRRFGKRATKQRAEVKLHRNDGFWHDRLSRDGFQIHGGKILPSLLRLLRCTDLAWDPTDRDGQNYLEMNRVVGEAIISALAFTCAQEQGLRIVTEFPERYAETIQRSPNDIFQSVIAERPKSRPPLSKQKGERLAETIIFRKCDLSLLDAESLAILSNEHEALSDFRDALEKFAAVIPSEMTDEKRINSSLFDRAEFVIKQWRQTKRNLLPRFLRIFGDESDEALKDLVKDGFKDAVVGAWLSPSGQALLGAGAGVAIGVAWRVMVGDDREQAGTGQSLRYLSMLQAHGVGVGVTPDPDP